MPHHTKEHWRLKQAFHVAVAAIMFDDGSGGYRFHPSNVNDEQLKAAARYTQLLIDAGITDSRLPWLIVLIRKTREAR